MRFQVLCVAAVLLTAITTGCAKAPKPSIDTELDRPAKAEVTAASYGEVDPATTASISNHSAKRLVGRTLRVASITDLQLRRGEVILTFDDGPSPTYTPQILDALADHGVKATFFMVGTMASAHPATAQQVARAGHTVGTHTHNHENLAKFSSLDAMSKVRQGEYEVARAIAPSGRKPAPFFRFPYLSQTRVLRTSIAELGLIPFGVDVDSWDYKKESAQTVMNRTLTRLETQGRGIILFHDIHGRTARLLPDFLDELDRRGFKVVHAIPGRQGLFSAPVTVAALDQ